MSIWLFLLLIFLTLVQVSVLPLNFGFVVLFGLVLVVDKFNALVWLTIFSLLLSLFGNLNFGLVIVAFISGLLLLDIVKLLIPDNRLTNGLLIVAAFPLSTFSLLFFSKILR